jgi:hypothetical protein
MSSADVCLKATPECMTDNLVRFSITLFIGLFILAIILYCLSSILILLKEWVSINKISRTKTRRSSKEKSGNNILIATDDDEVYINDLPMELDDQYTKITKSIQNSFLNFKLYNQKLTEYYLKAKGVEPTEKMDASILSPSNDDW